MPQDGDSSVSVQWLHAADFKKTFHFQVLWLCGGCYGGRSHFPATLPPQNEGNDVPLDSVLAIIPESKYNRPAKGGGLRLPHSTVKRLVAAMIEVKGTDYIDEALGKLEDDGDEEDPRHAEDGDE